MALTVTPAMEAFVAAVDRLLAEDPFTFSAAVQLGDTEALLTQSNRLDAALTGYLNALWSSEATVEACGQGLKGWLVHDQHLSGADAGRRIKLARDLTRRDQVAMAMREGAISAQHAAAITGTVDAFPAEEQEMVEKELTEAARFTNPGELARACRDLKDHLGLNGSAEERYAALYGKRYLKTASTIDGMVKVDAMLEPAAAASFKEALAPLRRKQGADDDRTQAQRDHDALAAIVGLALRTGELPEHGGQTPQVIVTVPLGELIDGLDPLRTPLATIDGQPLPPSAVRKLACDAGIIPAVLDGHSEVLDLGRSSRSWSKAQRLAARLRDGDTCTWPGGCTTPIRYCELHHLQFWTEHRGKTDHLNSAHICGFHHWLVHNRDWKLWRDHDGTLRHRRT